MEDSKQLLSQGNFTDQEVEEIMSRASKLQQEASAAGGRIKQSDLEAGAAEVGIPREFIEQAIQELKAERERETARRKSRRRNFIVAAVLIAIVIIVPALLSHRALNARMAEVEAKQAQLENVLQRRHDLIPKLIDVAKASVEHEKKLIAFLSNTYQELGKAKDFEEKQAIEKELNESVQRMMDAIRSDPEASSTIVFLHLSDEMAGTENRIAVERKRYNEAVAAYNRAARSFPALFYRPIFRFPGNIKYFQASEETKKVPTF